MRLREASNHFEAQGAIDACVATSGVLKTLAVSVSPAAVSEALAMGQEPVGQERSLQDVIAAGGRATERMALPVWVFIFIPLVALVVVPTLVTLVHLAA